MRKSGGGFGLGITKLGRIWECPSSACQGRMRVVIIGGGGAEFVMCIW